MTESAASALLPAGLRDILPPFAAHEADAVARIMSYFAQRGYERIKPPLIEFEDSLLSGSGAAMAKHSFRLMDPVSQRMLALRADMTPQIARIATTRLVNSPRPLRLSYAGQVLRVKGTQLRPDRQLGQAGIELIGSDSAAADAEIVTFAAGALAAIGIKELSVDLTLPALVPAIVQATSLPQLIRDALDHKDVAAVRNAVKDTGLANWIADRLVSLIEAAGPAARALEQMGKLELPPSAKQELVHLAEVVKLLREAAPGLTLTIDPVENRGFEYHTGIAFALFARHAADELGRGGRYMADGIPATGATLFMDAMLEAAPGPQPARRLFLPHGTKQDVADKLRGEGWVTVAGLEPTSNASKEAKRLGCGHVLENGKIGAVG